MVRGRMPGTPDIQRLAKRMEDGQDALRKEFNAGFDRIMQVVESVQQEVRIGNMERRQGGIEIQDLRNQVQMTRDLGNKLLEQVNAGAAANVAAAAAGATAAMVGVTERGSAAQAIAALPKSFFATWKGWVTMACAGVAALGAAVGALPPIVRFVSTVGPNIAAMIKAIGEMK